jgi:hypothetical protein
MLLLPPPQPARRRLSSDKEREALLREELMRGPWIAPAGMSLSYK